MELADFIRTNLDPILGAWERFAQGIPAARHFDSAALRDHARGILQAIAADLDLPQTALAREEKAQGRGPHPAAASQAELHGAARLAKGFSVNQTMSEFRALRASVQQLWVQSNPLAAGADACVEQLIRFNEGIDQALTESLARYTADIHLLDTLLSSSPDQCYIFDPEGRYIYANRALAALYGKASGADLVGRDLFELGDVAAVELRQQLQLVIERKTIYRGEIPSARPRADGAVYEYLFVPVLDEDGGVVAITGTARDITERNAAEQRLRRSANYDALTGLPNRSLFHYRLELEVRRAARGGRRLALFFIDLDGFKETNDRLGHAAGDELLQQAARRIADCVRGVDAVARLGGDEFTVLLTDFDKTLHVELLAERILKQLSRAFPVGPQLVHISASIGITLFPQDAAAPADLIRNADQAMYAAKRSGRNRFSFFTLGMREAAWARMKVIDELRQALPRRQFSVYYQPIVALPDQRIVKAEALLRWRHPENGLMAPDEFIELAEETGLIGPIDEWVFAQATARAREWSALLGAPFQISVNKSPVELMSQEPMTVFERHLTALGVAWSSISVEITEGVLLIDSPIVRDKLGMLQQAGVELAIDDFGTGHSSMAYLKKFAVDYLKIDQSFVQDMATSDGSRTIVETIIVMAHKLGLKVIAEGVETAAQRDWLHAAGCDYAQGYLFSRPVPAPDFAQLLALGVPGT